MITTLYRLTIVASNYGDGAYGSSTYNGATTTTSGSGTNTGTGTSGGSGVLSNTGVMVGLIVGVAATTLLAAMIVRIWRQPNRVAEAVAPIEPETDSDQDQASESDQPNQ
jgi:hypothetical protein